MDFDDRCNRILTTSHVVYSNDFSIHIVDGIETHQDDIFVKCKDGMMFKDLDVFTLEEAGEMEQEIINICKLKGINYND